MSGDEHKPRLREDLDLQSLSLTAEEGYLVSRIDGMTSMRDLSLLTGLSDAKVSEILGRLWRQGALEPEKKRPSAADPKPLSGRRPGAEAEPVEAGTSETDQPPTERAPVDRHAAGRGAVDRPDGERAAAEVSSGPEEAEPASELVAEEVEVAEDRSGPEEGEPVSGPVAEEVEVADESSTPEEAEPAAKRNASYRRLFMEQFSSLDVDARVARAKEARGENLAALCFDPDPRVIRAVLENADAGLEHARLIAAHHRSGTGLGHLGQKAALIRDRQTQRLLFRNPQLPDILFEKILAPRRMVDAYRLALSRDITERVKSNARRTFRKKFADGTAEERVSLILSTEGRCLPMLLGVPLDGRSASLLAGRPIHSTLLVQNLARWPATPPVVLVHLAKQPMVRRTPSLAEMLRRHPNAPSSLKRGSV